MAFVRPTAFDERHPARATLLTSPSSSKLQSNAERMKADLGFEVESDGDTGSINTDGDEELDLASDLPESRETPQKASAAPIDARRAPGSNGTKTSAAPPLVTVASLGASSFARAIGGFGSSFGAQSKTSGGDGYAGTDADRSHGAASGFGQGAVEALRDLQNEKAKLAEENSKLEAKIASVNATNSTMRKLLLTTLVRKDAALEQSISKMQASAPAPLLLDLNAVLAKERQSTEVAQRVAAKAGDDSSHTTGHSGSVPHTSHTAVGREKDGSAPSWDNAEVLSLRAEVDSLREGSMRLRGELSRASDFKRLAAATSKMAAEYADSLPHELAASLNLLSDFAPAGTSPVDASFEDTGFEAPSISPLVDAAAGRTPAKTVVRGGGSGSVSVGGAEGSTGGEEVDVLRSEVAKERRRVELLKAQVTQMTSQSVDTKAKMEEAISRREALAREVAVVAATRDQQARDLALKQGEIDRLKRGVDSATAASELRATEIARISAELEAAKAEAFASSRSAAAATAAASVNDATADADALRAMHATETAALASQLASSREEASMYKQREGELLSTVTRLTAALDQAREGESATATATTANRELEARVRQLTEEVGKVAIKEREIRELQAALAEASAEAEEVKSNSTSSLSAAAADREALSRTFTSRIEMLEREVRTKQQQLEEALGATRAADAQVSTATAVHTKQVHELREALAASERAGKAALEAAEASHAHKVDSLRAEHAAITASHERQIVTLQSSAKSLHTLLSTMRIAHSNILRDHKALSAEAAAFPSAMAANIAQIKAAVTREIMKQAEAVAALTLRYKKEVLERRKLHNLVQELRGNIRVYCRVRPPLAFELETGNDVCVAFPDVGEISVVNAKKQSKSWEFDQVFKPTANNDDIFKEVESLVTSSLDGYNVCIFAYGQTGSGKTFTMEGTEECRGINWRTLSSLFGQRDERKGDITYDFSLSMLEIYNENIQDMLAPRASPADGATKIAIREGPQGVFVPDLTVKPVSNHEDVAAIMKQGYRNRTTFATNMNEHSSRSHCMLSIYLVGTHKFTGQVMRGKLHLIDLAGSERVGRSGATGDRLKEAQAINKSLSALGDVIQARGEKRSHIPYRNSTLTWLLSDSLAGDSKTLMFVNLSPVASNSDESFCSLNFAARVRNVEMGKAVKHVSGAAAKGTPSSSTGRTAVSGAGSGSTDVGEAGEVDDWGVGLLEDSELGEGETPSSSSVATPAERREVSTPSTTIPIPSSTPRAGASATAPLAVRNVLSPGKAPVPTGPPAAGSTARRMLALGGKK